MSCDHVVLSAEKQMLPYCLSDNWDLQNWIQWQFVNFNQFVDSTVEIVLKELLC
jgi:hypothetical protein